MLELVLNRGPEMGEATPGRLFVPGLGIPIYTIEDKWRDNAKEVSCIPPGTYTCVPHGWEPNSTVHQKRCWEITNVPGRKDVLIHSGNTHLDTLGCVLVGLVPSNDRRNATIARSRDAVDLLRQYIGANSFKITIRGAGNDVG